MCISNTIVLLWSLFCLFPIVVLGIVFVYIEYSTNKAYDEFEKKWEERKCK